MSGSAGDVDEAIRAFLRAMTDYYLWAIGAATATLTLYILIRANWPRVAHYIAMPLQAAGWCFAAFYRVPRWFWRQAWRGADGVSRGPIARRRMRQHADLARTIHEVTAPQFRAGRRASLAQHTVQNERIDALSVQVAGLGERMGLLEDHITRPPRKARTG